MSRLNLSLLLVFLLLGLSVTALCADSSVVLIEKAQKLGEIDSKTAIVYKTLSVVAPDELPASFRSTAPVVEKCATTIMLELAKTWPDLSQSAKASLSPHLVTQAQLIPKDPANREKSVSQPTLTNNYQTANFNIEWGPSVPYINEWQDQNPENGIPDYIDNLASYLEASWSGEVTTLQLLAPYLSNNYLVNVYVGNTGSGSPSISNYVYGYATVYPYSGLNGQAGVSFMVLNSDLSDIVDIVHNDDPEGDFLGALKVTVAHEFFHNIQFAYDIDEAGWMMEMCATWMEDEVFDVVNDYFSYLQGDGGWQNFPHTSLAYFNGNDLHEYGDVIFAKYLSETYPTVNIMKELWERLDNVSGDNAISAIGNFLSSQ